VADRAVDLNLNLLVSYHPLIFNATNKFVAGSGPVGRAYQLARAGAALAIFHTAWDAAPGGTADSLASALGLREVRRFGPVEASAVTKLVTFVPVARADMVAQALVEAGAGQIGNYLGCTFRSEGLGTFIPGPGAEPAVGQVGIMSREDEVRLEVPITKAIENRVIAALFRAHPYEEPPFDLYEVRSNLGLIGRIGILDHPTSLATFSELVSGALTTSVRCSGDRNQTVSRVAVLPGSGSSFMAEAAAAGADVFVSGDLGHHPTRVAQDLGMSTIDAGHAATELPGVAQLLAVTRSLVPEAIDLTDDAIPWKEN
jgi:dinuclear metal center YbgI/SA1388 family protein